MIIVQTPLRISFVGGGTDFSEYFEQHGGAVLSTAIDKYIFVIVKERFDDLICVNYTRREVATSVDEIKHELVREALRKAGIEKGIEITTLADIPAEGTGLGSSSTVTVGLLSALFAYKGENTTAEFLAREASNIEIDILHKPIGYQDQYIAAYGNLRYISFTSHSIDAKKVDLPREQMWRLNNKLMLFYTGKTRSADTILVHQKANITDRIHVLDSMRDMASEAHQALIKGAFDEFGLMLHKNWELKKLLADGINTDEIENLYSTALKAGATGGKITGAGGGGFLLLYCPEEKQDNVRNSLKLRELPFHFEMDGGKVIFNYRRHK